MCEKFALIACEGIQTSEPCRIYAECINKCYNHMSVMTLKTDNNNNNKLPKPKPVYLFNISIKLQCYSEI